MDIQPPATLANEDRIQLLGTFAAPSREQAYRAKFRRDDLWLARVCMLAAMARVLLFGIVDYHPLAATGFWFPLGCRAAFVLVSFWVLVSLRSVGRLFFAWCMLLAAATICFIFLKMPGDTRFVYMTLASVGLAYAVAPLPLLWQMLVAIPFSIAGFGILLGADRSAAFSLGPAFLLVNAVGIVISRHSHYCRRQGFLSSLREARVRIELEQALAEVKTLRGHIPICAWCKKVRDEDNAWQSVESYVTQRTYCDFSHGMCPLCAREQLRHTTAKH